MASRVRRPLSSASKHGAPVGLKRKSAFSDFRKIFSKNHFHILQNLLAKMFWIKITNVFAKIFATFLAKFCEINKC
jgi:hypothetical protein